MEEEGKLCPLVRTSGQDKILSWCPVILKNRKLILIIKINLLSILTNFFLITKITFKLYLLIYLIFNYLKLILNIIYISFFNFLEFVIVSQNFFNSLSVPKASI